MMNKADFEHEAGVLRRWGQIQQETLEKIGEGNNAQGTPDGGDRDGKGKASDLEVGKKTKP